MNIYIIIPAHNEQEYISSTLDSLINQTLLPKQLVVVNDNSTDNTQEIISQYCKKYDWIHWVNLSSSDNHIPGAKIINAFYKGYQTLDNHYDIICKFDADLIFPNTYLETISSHFKTNKKLGMVAGHCYIKKNEQWVIESLTNTDHIRGGLKAYRQACFLEIGKLKRSMGWDTVDELLAKYYGWSLKTDSSLKVKHLKPTGSTYKKGTHKLQGEALYKLRSGIILAFLSAAKLAYKKKSITLFKDYILGYFRARSKKMTPIVTKEQGKYIRNLRWEGILRKFTG